MSIFSRHHLNRLPIAVLMPHGGCNCRCIMCDYWKGSRRKPVLSVADLSRQRGALQRLQVQWVLLSGGEPLLHNQIWELTRLLEELAVRVSILSNGLLLEELAERIPGAFDEVILSLDGSREVHDRIRGVPGLFQKMARGIELLRAGDPRFRVSGRSVVQKANHQDLLGILEAARGLGLDQISFLPVDLNASAFDRKQIPADLALDADETQVFREGLRALVRRHKEAFASGYIAESPKKLQRIARYFDAVNQQAPFVAPRCNAPWVSAVIEADGAVKPCFFHPPYGNLREGALDEILNHPRSIAFRESLKVRKNPTCRSCVCPLYLPRKKLQP